MGIITNLSYEVKEWYCLLSSKNTLFLIYIEIFRIVLKPIYVEKHCNLWSTHQNLLSSLYWESQYGLKGRHRNYFDSRRRVSSS